MKDKTTGGSSHALKLGALGVTLAGIAATTYFFYGPKGEKHQRQTRAWAIKMKGDVVEKLEMTHNITKAVYDEIIDSVAAEYEKGGKASREEISALAADLKKHWRTISNSVHTLKQDVVTTAKKVATKVREG